MSRDPRVDAYIERQAEFAKPILRHLREAFHEACPEVEETIKWSMPAFTQKGQLLANIAAFKAHATLGFWRGELILGDNEKQRTAMGQFGRLTSIDDLPDPETLEALIRKAVALAEQGVKPVRSKTVKAEIPVPEDLEAALQANPAAQATFTGFPPSCRREYLEWVVEAKRPGTRTKRIGQTVEWLAAGKRRNWKYENC
jgi:uncharacterized protein YdeI (YjbR/CyaY-like superfamily)